MYVCSTILTALSPTSETSSGCDGYSQSVSTTVSTALGTPVRGLTIAGGLQMVVISFNVTLWFTGFLPLMTPIPSRILLP